MTLRPVLVCVLGAGLLLGCGAEPVKILVERSGPHSGSYWLGELFSAQNVKTFWQFYGDCGPPYGDLAMLDADAMRERQLEDLLYKGCNCPDMPMFQQCFQYKNRTTGVAQPGCGRAPFCQRSCPGPPGPECDSIAVVGDIVPTSRSDVVYVMFHRGNSVKQAVSMMKAKCAGMAEKAMSVSRNQARSEGLGGGFSNHPRGAGSHRAFLYVHNVQHLFSVAKNANRKRADMAQRGLELMNDNRRVVEIHYEDFQRDVEAAFEQIFEAIGLLRPTIRTDTEAGLSKPSSRDNLAETLLNFDRVNATMAAEPCFQQQLNAIEPEHFAICDDLSTPDDGEDGSVFRVNRKERQRLGIVEPQLPVFLDCNHERCGPPDCGQHSNFDASGASTVCAAAAWKSGDQEHDDLPEVCMI